MMKTVGRYARLEQAQTAKLTLGAAGIEAFIPDEMSAGLAPMFFSGKPGVRLQVDDADEEAAEELLSQQTEGDGEASTESE